MQLSCKALGLDRGPVPPLSQTVVCGEQRFLIALHAEGDAAARAAAERLVRAEAALRQTVSANRGQIDKQFCPTIVHRFAALLENEPSGLPEDWPDQLIYSPRAAGPNERLEQRLPRPVRQAVSAYVVAKREVLGLASPAPTQVQ